VRKSKDYSDRLLHLFKAIDTDNTGTIGILEFEEMWEDPALQALLSTLGISQSKAWKLFEIMTVGRSVLMSSCPPVSNYKDLLKE